MTRRGYFENQDGKFRLRIVEEGYDADDPGTPANKVIIDSDAIGTLSVFKSGVVTVTNNQLKNGRWIESGWGLPYVPLCMFSYPGSSAPAYSVPTETILRVTNDGIYIRYYPDHSAPPSMSIQWTAFRLPVLP